MTHFSPASMLLWATLAVLMQVFLVTHLWKYDRFLCLRWNAGRQPGAFKRIMTYSYLATMPLLIVFSVSMAAIKYQEGYAFAIPPPSPGNPTPQPDPRFIVPKPYQDWSPANQAWVVPLYLVLSVAWSLEMVTHLEELNFWLFLINQGPQQRQWFGSGEFKSWLIGSLAAVISMPLICALTRKNPFMCEAWVLFAGSVGSTLITAWFLVVLRHFPPFLARVRAEGAAPLVVVRLARFNELNVVRVIFRFMFTLPLMILAIDGIRHSANHPINESAIGTDLLVIIGGIGCMLSSAITILIFFPRSTAEAVGYRPRVPSVSPARARADGGHKLLRDTQPSTSTAATTLRAATDPEAAHQYPEGAHPASPQSPRTRPSPRSSREDSGTDTGTSADEAEADDETPPTPPTPPAPRHLNFRVPARPEPEAHEMVPPPRATHAIARTRSRPPQQRPSLHPYIAQYSSPIDLTQDDSEEAQV